MTTSGRSFQVAGPLAVLAAVVLGVFAFRNVIRPSLVPKRFATVAAGKVYRSGELTPAQLAAVVNENHIKTIIDLGAFKDDPQGQSRERRTAKALNVTRYEMQLEGDATGNPNYYLQALKLMSDPTNQPVLVHCGAGTHRTGCAVAFYRTIFEKQDDQAALAEAQKYAYDPSKHPHFAEVFSTWKPKLAAALSSGADHLEGAEPIAPAHPAEPEK